MRYLIDTNIFIYLATDEMSLSKDVASLLWAYDAEICMSMESVRELIVAYNKKGFNVKQWDSAEAMLNSITDEYFITILPVGFETMKTYARLRLNVAEDHNDPSDHVIISQAITHNLPLVSSDRKFRFYIKQGLDLIYNS